MSNKSKTEKLIHQVESMEVPEPLCGISIVEALIEQSHFSMNPMYVTCDECIEKQEPNAQDRYESS
jgi:hypothetical protein